MGQKEDILWEVEWGPVFYVVWRFGRGPHMEEPSRWLGSVVGPKEAEHITGTYPERYVATWYSERYMDGYVEYKPCPGDRGADRGLKPRDRGARRARAAVLDMDGGVET